MTTSPNLLLAALMLGGTVPSIPTNSSEGGTSNPDGRLEDRVKRRLPLALLDSGNGGLMDARRPTQRCKR